MSALTLLLVVGLCNAESPRICSYMDVTHRMEVASDVDCYDLAMQANRQNIESGETPRYDCVTPTRFLELVGEKPAPVKPKAGKVL